VEQNSIKEIFRYPQHPYTKALLACRPANHQRRERLPVVSDFMNTGYEIQPKKPTLPNREADQFAEILLRVNNLSVLFASKKNFLGKPVEFIKAVDDISFDVYKGETLGLVGESGCGKTTLGRTLLRLIEPAKGQITYNGIDLTAKKRDELKT